MIPRLRAAGVAVHRGHFPGTAKGSDGPFCFAHFDADTYRAASDFLDFFYPRLVTGGTLAIDDYRDPRCRGAERAVDEWAARTTACPIPTAPHQCMLVKAR